MFSGNIYNSRIIISMFLFSARVKKLTENIQRKYKSRYIEQQTRLQRRKLLENIIFIQQQLLSK